ncbi:hypothetical protein HDU76_003141, partial [Blyttiomyces sp. JEL0837]
ALANSTLASEILTPLFGILIIAFTVYCGYWGMRNELKRLIYGYVTGALLMIAFVMWRIQRIISPTYDFDYHSIKTPLLFWGFLSLTHLLAGILVAFNYKKMFTLGLKSLLDQEAEVKKRGIEVVQTANVVVNLDE